VKKKTVFIVTKIVIIAYVTKKEFLHKTKHGQLHIEPEGPSINKSFSQYEKSPCSK